MTALDPMTTEWRHTATLVLMESAVVRVAVGVGVGSEPSPHSGSHIVMLRALFRGVLTAKEIKTQARPEFAARPELYYPTQVFKDFGFHRAQCECGVHYWRRSPLQTTCGDSKCTGHYGFIGKKTQGYTYTEAWEGFKRSLTTARVPCEAINRYPVIARWRTDVDYVAAGIYCFQPACVTGEISPPANPLICPQFCVRFNDLDNIGLTGRHYSGFIMLGIQAFNYPGKYVFFKEECVEFNLRWLIEELRIAPERITLVEDVWAGGGNMGPCVEYFVDGLEVGNMVFMQYQTHADGRREELPIKIVDVGVGLERIPWLMNGSPTSYTEVFTTALPWLQAQLRLPNTDSLWSQFGPLSSRLNVDEADDLSATWTQLSHLLKMPVSEVQEKVGPTRDMYILLDHTRTALMVIQDGGLPANVGGGGNVRNILRRVFAILKSRNWWDKLGLNGLFELFERHKEDLKGIYGDFPPYKSFQGIIEMEYERWINTDKEQTVKLTKMLKKNNGKMRLEDWIVAVTTWGIPVDLVAQISKQAPPGNLYYAISELQEKQLPAIPSQLLYPTSTFPETISLCDDPGLSFTGKIVSILENTEEKAVVVLDRSAFYPLSGGQAGDTGRLKVAGKEYQVVDVQKSGPVVLHTLTPSLPRDISEGTEVTGTVDAPRRLQLTHHHTATHILFAACKEVLGPHIWQHGAKKTFESAHLDITHYQSLTHTDLTNIENHANRIIRQGIPITKSTMMKSEAEKKYGFRLYQGGVIAGKSLRIVDIRNTDIEACCGTHCDTTSEVGFIRILKAGRISDGVVRLHYVAGERALLQLNDEDKVLNTLVEMWNVPVNEVVNTAERFFTGYKKMEIKVNRLEMRLFEVIMKGILAENGAKTVFMMSEQQNPTFYFSNLPKYAMKLKEAGKGVVFIGNGFVFGVLGKEDAFDVEDIRRYVKGKEGRPVQIKTRTQPHKEVVAMGEVDVSGLQAYFTQHGVAEFQ